MVKIRLRRIGTKARPFYRVVVTPSTAARNGRFVENLGTYDPVRKPIHIQIDEERALHWLLNGAQPTETTAFLLSKVGILDKFFEARPKAKENYSFLDKRTASMSVQSVIAEPAAKKEAAPAPEAPAVEAVVAEPVAEVAVEPVVEAVAEPVAEAVVEESAAEETPAEAVAEEVAAPEAPAEEEKSE